MVDENERIVMRWPAYEGGTQTTVEWTFTPRSHDTTFVTVTNTGFSGDQESTAKQAIAATEGFTLVLAGM
ncbi:MAG TPA: SRPBCC domain-containing protein [Actinomycetota bacterium]|nr:SRPBCC domain-containing protein [Actinomycetota bacterium]